MTIIGTAPAGGFGVGAGVPGMGGIGTPGMGMGAPMGMTGMGMGGPGLPPLNAQTAQLYTGMGMDPGMMLAMGNPNIFAVQQSPTAPPNYLATDFMNGPQEYQELLGMGNMEAIQGFYDLQTQAYQNYMKTGIYGVDPFVAANSYTSTLNTATGHVQSLAKGVTASSKSMLGALQDAVKQTTPKAGGGGGGGASPMG